MPLSLSVTYNTDSHDTLELVYALYCTVEREKIKYSQNEKEMADPANLLTTAVIGYFRRWAGCKFLFSQLTGNNPGDRKRAEEETVQVLYRSTYKQSIHTLLHHDN
jgi:hypothetical protein